MSGAHIHVHISIDDQTDFLVPGILLDSHMPKRVSLIPALLRQARSQTYRFVPSLPGVAGWAGC